MLRAAFLPCLVLAVLTGCGPRRTAPPNPSAGGDPPVADPGIREGSLQNGFLTVRVALPADTTAPVPAVLTLLGEEESLRARGIAAVSFKEHWELLRDLAPPPAPPSPAPPARSWGNWMLASPSPHTVGQGYFQLIAASATRTVPQVLDWLAGVPEIDMRRVGIIGTSTSGFMALQAAAADPRIVAVAALAACGDYHDFLAHSTLGLAGTEPFLPTPEYRTFLAEQEPIRHPQRLVHAAVLMVNGDADQVIPVECARRTAKVLARAYAKAQARRRFEFVVIPGGGHSARAEVTRPALDWLQRWLVGPEAVGRWSTKTAPGYTSSR